VECVYLNCVISLYCVCVEVNTSAVLVCSTEEFLCELVILSEFVFLHKCVCACFHPPRETSKVLLLAFV